MDGRDFGSTVTMFLCDGRRLVRRVAVPKGDAGNRISAADLTGKFNACVAPLLGAARTSSLLGEIQSLAQMRSIRELTEAVKGAV